MTQCNFLVEPEWLETHLGDPTIRVIDTSVDIIPRPPGPSEYKSRYSQYLEKHIPGAAYLHMVDDLSDSKGAFPFALPPVEYLWQKLSALGIASGDTIVLYGNEVHWATHRCWWVLATAGADVRVLNGNFSQWLNAERPTESGQQYFDQSDFKGQFKDQWVSDKDDVIHSMDDESTALVNALSAEQFVGRGQPFGRPGRIPGSISIPSAGFVDGKTGEFLPLETLAQLFEKAGANTYQHLITYCGGGIAASTSFFVLHLLGYTNVSLYDGSLLEWSADPSLPLLAD
ncbi:MAG: sulfurtransferase [Oceanicoccus sp.]